MSAVYVSPSMEAYELPDTTPDRYVLALCGDCTHALMGYTSAQTGDPATDEAADLMEDQWGYPYETALTATAATTHSASPCDGCGTNESGPRSYAVARRIG